MKDIMMEMSFWETITMIMILTITIQELMIMTGGTLSKAPDEMVDLDSMASTMVPPSTMVLVSQSGVVAGYGKVRAGIMNIVFLYIPDLVNCQKTKYEGGR